MSAPNLIVLDPQGDPRGRRYSGADRERAFQTWKGSAGGRSLRRVADSLGIAHSTISTWSVEDRWMERVRVEDQEEADAARAALSARVLPGVEKAIARLEKLIADEKTPAMAVVRGIELYVGLAGFGPPKQTVSLTDLDPHRGRPRVAAKDLAAMTPDELDAYVEEKTGRIGGKDGA